MLGRACVLIVLVAACPAKGPREPAVVGVGCPAARDVYLASYVRPGEGAKGHTGWVLPLHDAKVASLEQIADYATIAASVATTAGVPAPPQHLWLLQPNAAPCQASVGAYYAAAIDVATPNVTYGVELSGCPAPVDPSDAVAIALVSDQPPSQCKPSSPHPVAARLGELDKANVWSRPTKETPIPPAFAAIIPEHECVAPDCEKLWSIAQVEVAGKPVVWGGAVNWLSVHPGGKLDAPCEWKLETFAGIFVANAEGVPVQLPPLDAARPLVLTAVLMDAGGARIVLAEGTGEYATYDLVGGEAKLGRHLVWLIDHPDAYSSVDHLGPECGS